MLEQHGINIYNRDCLEAMREMPDNAFDLAIVDPPYRDKNQPTKDMRANGSMDSIKGRPSIEYWNELKRVSKEQIIWGANNFELPQWMGFVVWKKKTIGEEFTMSMCEIAAISEGLGTVSKWIEIQPQDPDRIHPNQKPVALYKWLLDKYAKPGDRILDTHLGSGSIGIACYTYGYNLTGFELDADYFNAAKRRIENHIGSHQKLF
jgi:site-specific DNA-methyltransferase (adenine-specific)